MMRTMEMGRTERACWLGSPVGTPGTPRTKPCDPREETLVRAVLDLQRGRHRESSFRLLHQTYRDDLSRYFLRRGWSREEAEDLVQETFLNVATDIGRFRHEAPFRHWLFVLAGNCMRRTLRYRGASKRAADEVALDAIAPSASPSATVMPVPTPLEQSLDLERSTRVRRAAQQLPAQMRRCVLLGLERDLGAAEIGQALSIKPATVRVVLFRARGLLRSALREMVSAPS